MKHFIAFFLILISLQSAFSQEKHILEYDPCSEDISKKTKKDFEKAYNTYLDGNLDEASKQFRELIVKEPEFATPYFLIGLIGARLSNNATIEKFFPKVLEICPNYSHPLLYYYLGLIDYTYERFDSCVVNLNKFQKIAFDDPSISDSLIDEANNYLQWSSFISETKSNPVEFNPYPIQNISTKDDEFLPFISHDREKIFFTRRMFVKEEEDNSFYEKDNVIQKEIFCLASKKEDGTYDKGFPLEEPFNNVYNEGGATLTADNRELYYTVCQLKDEYINCDIYYSNWLGEYWSDIKPLGQSINTPGT